MKLPVDLTLHLLAGYGFAAFLLPLLPPNPQIHVPVVFFSTAALGALKELYDLKIKKTNFDVADMVATWTGGALYIFWTVFLSSI